MRLIDADALKENNCELWERDFNHPKYEDTLGDIIADAPTIDAVEVVRCGECKHMIADGRCMEFADDGIRPSASDYCSYGERREEREVEE